MIMVSYTSLKKDLDDKGVKLVAVSKTKPISAIQQLYDKGQRVFGENKALECLGKYEKLPKDIEWHFIGHLQRNKVKYIAPFVDLIHAVDSRRLLSEIDKQAKKHNRVIKILLQGKIAEEEAKYGFLPSELPSIIEEAADFPNINVIGLMGMATNTDDKGLIIREFSILNNVFKGDDSLNILSMGMSNDYNLALECGSNLVRIGSLLFGTRP